MGQSCDLSFQQRSLFQQGYQSFTQQELKQLEWGLRFTPTACSSITGYALVTQNPYLLFVVGSLGIWAFFFPAKHPMDLLYNHFVRHLFGAINLPENPFQRRLACLAAGVMNFTAGFLFMGGFTLAAWGVGGILLLLQAIVITTHFCTLSWMYEGLMRLFGKWNQPVEIEHAKNLLNSGAVLIDVRSPIEVANGTLEGAINLPLEELEKHLDKFKENICLLFCSSGTRGHIAKQKLENLGIADIFNLGTLERARTVTS